MNPGQKMVTHQHIALFLAKNKGIFFSVHNLAKRCGVCDEHMRGKLYAMMPGVIKIRYGFKTL